MECASVREFARLSGSLALASDVRQVFALSMQSFDFRLIHRPTRSSFAVYRSKQQQPAQHHNSRRSDAPLSPNADSNPNPNDSGASSATPASRHVDKRADSLVIQVVNNYSPPSGDAARGRGRGQRGRGRGASRGRGRDQQFDAGDGRAHNAPQEQVGGRRVERGKPRSKKGWVEWEAEQAEKEAARANRVTAQSLNAPIDAEVLGRAIIVTSSERDQPAVGDATSPEATPTEDTASSKKHAKLSQHSEGSWETCDEENDDASSADGDAHEDDANESVLEAPEIADEYVEDDYFDDGLQLHDQSPVAAAIPLPSDADADLGSLQRSPRDPDDDSNTRDDHNSSAESLERFIVQHTLRIDS